MKEFIECAKRNGYIDSENNITGTTYPFSFVISQMSDGSGIKDIVLKYRLSLVGSNPRDVNHQKANQFEDTLLQIFDLMRRDVEIALKE